MKYSEFNYVLHLIDVYEETEKCYNNLPSYHDEEYKLAVHENPFDFEQEELSAKYEKASENVQTKLDELESEIFTYITVPEFEELRANKRLFNNYFVNKALDVLAVSFPDVECNIKGLIEIGKEAAEIKDKINKWIPDELWGEDICSDEDLYEYLDQHPELSTTENEDTCKVWGKIDTLLDAALEMEIDRSER